jgi:zinc and cadmium transporter
VIEDRCGPPDGQVILARGIDTRYHLDGQVDRGLPVPSADIWVWTGLALVAISLISLIGAATLVGTDVVTRALPFLVPFAAGALLGDAFLHIIPEISESESGFTLVSGLVALVGLVGFFTLEKVLHWHHAHLPEQEVLHPVAVTNLLADALHNFIDGAVVAGAFLVSFELGVATAIAVALHEIPQELGDFGILVHAGLAPRRALGLNLLTGLTAIAGGVLTLSLAGAAPNLEWLVLPLTSGGFVYIAATDLLPVLHKEPEGAKSIVQVLSLLAGIAVMAALLLLE